MVLQWSWVSMIYPFEALHSYLMEMVGASPPESEPHTYIYVDIWQTVSKKRTLEFLNSWIHTAFAADMSFFPLVTFIYTGKVLDHSSLDRCRSWPSIKCLLFKLILFNYTGYRWMLLNFQIQPMLNVIWRPTRTKWLPLSTTTPRPTYQ